MKKIVSSVLAAAAFSLLVMSCETDQAYEGNYATITFTQGTDDTVYEFTLPYEEDDIYADTTTAADNASLTAYKIQAKNGYNDPFQSIEVLFVPAQSGNESPYLTVVFYDRLEQNGNTSDIYQQRTFTLDSSAGLTTGNYKKSIIKGGKLFLSWQVGDENSVECDSAYTSSTVNHYNIKGLSFLATIR
ncbi:hypothetical protein [Treponema sp.]|uniref:hypothetical protein n=1 Tax=Treponema sp. TaxID=166 RepID=UPI0025F57823|nr:hypothetical protein [Treponema sp.]MCR5219338.1 hypothetical protein [Treponema sp.]